MQLNTQCHCACQYLNDKVGELGAGWALSREVDMLRMCGRKQSSGCTVVTGVSGFIREPHCIPREIGAPIMSRLRHLRAGIGSCE